MTRDDLIQLAKQANFDWYQYNYKGTKNALEDFAALVAAHEREACAKVCEDDGLLWGQRYAAAIRARGEKP